MAESDSQSMSVMFCFGYTQTLLEGLHEEILSIVEFHEVDRTLHEENCEIL